MISNANIIMNHARTAMRGFRSSREKIINQFGEEYYERLNDMFNSLLDELDALSGDSSQSFSNNVPTDQVIRPHGTENENIIV